MIRPYPLGGKMFDNVLSSRTEKERGDEILDCLFDHSNLRKGELKSEFLQKHHPSKKNLVSNALLLP